MGAHEAPLSVAPEPTRGLRIGEDAPGFCLPDLDGVPVRLSDFRGRQVLVLFCDPGCEYCQHLYAYVREWEVRPPDEAPILLVVSTGGVRANQAMGLNSRVVIEPSDRPVGDAYGAEGTPTAVMIDAEGRIASPLIVGGLAIHELIPPQPQSSNVEHRVRSEMPVPGPLIIAGLGRSRSSLVALFLTELGLDLGESLLPPNQLNPAGYGEDLEMLALERAVLAASRTKSVAAKTFPETRWSPGNRHIVSEEHLATMQRYLEHRAAVAAAGAWAWGWKQPRSTLSLDSWHEVADQPKFLLLYRHPMGVAASLKRMSGITGPNRPQLEVWAMYNRHVVEFARAHRDQTLLIDTGHFLANPQRLAELLRDRFGYAVPVDRSADAYRALVHDGLVRRSRLDDEGTEDLPAEVGTLWDEVNVLSDMPALDWQHSGAIEAGTFERKPDIGTRAQVPESPESGSVPTLALPIPMSREDTPARRAIVCFVPDNRDHIQQALALRRSWLHVQSPDTDLVMMGPASALTFIPDDVVKIVQRPVQHDPEWRGFICADSVVSMNGAGAERLDRYSHLLRTDVDTFIAPGWNTFYPEHFITGNGGYSNDEEIQQRLREIAARYGLAHRGFTNVGSTWYGPTDVVRRASAFAEMLTKYLLSHYFAGDEGVWPGWYRGVALLYAGEIAVNHCAPDAERSEWLDDFSTTGKPASHAVHIHCWHTEDKFSKHFFMAGRYGLDDARGLDLNIVRDYCMAMSFLSLCDLDPLAAPGIRSALESSRDLLEVQR